LRRPTGKLREADVLAFVLEAMDELERETLRSVRALAPDAVVVRFRRSLDGIFPVGERRVPSPALGHDAPVALVTGVGAPSRVERLLAASGARIVLHASFPDHARFREDDLARALDRAERAGATQALVTEKDEARWPRDVRAPIPVRVLRTRLEPLDPVDPRLLGLVSAGGASGGHAVGLTPSGASRPS
jgi:tetraacyldisaccharide-1-P 4'-kinase